MKRLLSWVVLLACMVAFYYADYYFCYLLLIIFNAIYGVSEVLFWVLVVSGGSTSLFLIIFGIIEGGVYTVKASQAVCPTTNGARYVAFPVIMLVFDLILLLGLVVGYVRGSGILFPAALVVLLIYCISVIVSGQKVAMPRAVE